eukprot:TRINITY_DN2273_c0_g1_i2.p1 TRINITY_DN2273_c0_g1~~TRINITY_DN2273_c0_g1_i2.p1  ORF type:complete len:155 (+),score=46.15 TRINITY_DN2273_c0_g1_i2:59-466(+)
MSGGAALLRTSAGLEKLPAQAVHLLPCSVQHDGPTDVTAYFKVAGSGDEQQSTLRGRALSGCTVQVPDNQEGWVFRNSASEPHAWAAHRAVDSFTCWTHGADAVGQSSGLRKLLNGWQTVADCLADPVTPECSVR